MRELQRNESRALIKPCLKPTLPLNFSVLRVINLSYLLNQFISHIKQFVCLLLEWLLMNNSRVPSEF